MLIRRQYGVRSCRLFFETPLSACQRLSAVDGKRLASQASLPSATLVTLGETISGAKWKESRADRSSALVCCGGRLRSTSLMGNTPAPSWRRTQDSARVVPHTCVTAGSQGSYLVDPASSHMLVSKIKPCMSKYKLLYTVKLRMAH